MRNQLQSGTAILDEGSQATPEHPSNLITHFNVFVKKLIHSFQILSYHQRLYVHVYEQICPTPPAPSALILSMHPHANPFAAPLTPVPRPHAAPATKHSSAAMTSPLQSACSAPLNSLILSYSISVSQSPSYKATSPSTNKTFYSPKNRPCSLRLKLPSPMTASSRALTNKLRTSPRKSNNSSPSKMIYYTPNGNFNVQVPKTNTKTKTKKTWHNNSFTAALIPTATASSLPPGSALPATSTPAHIAGNSRPNAMTTHTFATPTPSPLSPC